MNLTARLAHDLTLKGGIALRLMSTAGDKSVRLVAAFATFGTRRVYQSGARKVRPAGRGRPRPRSTAGHAPVPRATAAAAAKRRRARKPRGDTGGGGGARAPAGVDLASRLSRPSLPCAGDHPVVRDWQREHVLCLVVKYLNRWGEGVADDRIRL